MAKLLLKSVVLDGKQKDVLIDGNKFSKIADSIQLDGAFQVDCSGLAILPPFYNAHNHAAMTLLRGYADDLPLFTWLQKHVWPFEAKMGGDEIEIGSRLAALEMIKSGTVFFSDMYWKRERTIKVVEEMGMRAAIGVTIADQLTAPDGLRDNFRFLREHRYESERVHLCVMPHAVYTNSEKTMATCVQIAREEGYVFHTHLSETLDEVNNCKRDFGCTPTELWKRLGLFDDDLGKRSVFAHCVYLSESDMLTLAEAGATIVFVCSSNLKLGSGIPNIPAILKKGIKTAIGTDGASSNNTLDMHQETKLVSLLAKVNLPNHQGNVEMLPAQQALYMATRGGALAYGIDGGEIAEGRLADALLVHLDNPRLVPCHNLVSNWIYSADSTAIDSVICNGKFIMTHGHIDGEEEILKDAEKCAKRLASSC
ncbi:MAG: amidohydrolase [Fibrobacteraceae bacterium]|nr:amidohydrolase [Fibrobacteraceae bacterium]